MTSSVAGSRRSSKAKLAWKKDYGHCLVVSCPFDQKAATAFWIPEIPLHLRSMLSKSTPCIENSHTYCHHCSTQRAQFFSMTPDHMLHNQHVKSWTNWVTKLCLIHHIHLNSQPTDYHFLKHLHNDASAGKMNASTISRRQKILSKSSSNPKAWTSCYRNKQTYFSLAKMCWL